MVMTRIESTDERFPIERPDKSLADLVSDLTGELSDLFRNHVELAKSELRDEASSAARASAMLVAAAVSALLALAMWSAALGWALAETMAPGWAFLIVAVIWTALATALALVGKQRLRSLERPVPQTMDEIKEDQRWLTTRER
jgi:uncharacterized membrane protein YqjE